MAIEDHLDYLPGEGHLKEMRVMAAGLQSFGIAAYKSEVMAVYLWRGLRKANKGERIYLQGQSNGR